MAGRSRPYGRFQPAARPTNIRTGEAIRIGGDIVIGVVIQPSPLTAAAFAPYGDVIEANGQPDKLINNGTCARYHDRAILDVLGGRIGISLLDAEACEFPLTIKMLERHPEGSQAFVPISQVPFLLVVGSDRNGTPVDLKAFVTQDGQSVNIHRGVWHGILASIKPGQYVVIDRIGDGPNLEEHWFDTSFVVEAIEVARENCTAGISGISA